MAPRPHPHSGNPDGRRQAEGSRPALRRTSLPRAGRGTFASWLARIDDSLVGDAIGLACLVGILVLGLYAAPILEELVK